MSTALADAHLARGSHEASPPHAATDTCRVCGGRSQFVYRRPVLGQQVRYYDCPQCGYLQTETPYWLEQAYGSAINDVDTGILMRNGDNLRRVVMTLLAMRKLHGRVIDYAGGYGILVRLLRDAGVDAYWEDRYCSNLLARGFESDGGGADLLTAFEVFEHLVDPVTELERMLQKAPVVLLSTELVTTSEPPPEDWWYLGPEHGQHIGFFRLSTLRVLAEKAGCGVQSDGRTLHLFSRSGPVPAWPRCLKFARWWRWLTRSALQPKTMSDFDALRKARPEGRLAG